MGNADACLSCAGFAWYNSISAIVRAFGARRVEHSADLEYLFTGTDVCRNECSAGAFVGPCLEYTRTGTCRTCLFRRFLGPCFSDGSTLFTCITARRTDMEYVFAGPCGCSRNFLGSIKDIKHYAGVDNGQHYAG